ncbi:MAG: response regulator, partial [Deltaproteobacteria bacterium]|nr:response regulator [Deltaproteobacteria bacterium]
DWMMPKMDGLELCRRVKAGKNRPYLYVMLVTSKREKRDLVAGFEAGADDFLTKPIDPDEFKSRLTVGIRTIKYERTLVEQNDRLDEYAANMEALAKERAQQLIHSERLALLGTLSAGLAHEISNPITYINVNIGVIESIWETAHSQLQEARFESSAQKATLLGTFDEMPDMIQEIKTGIDRTGALVEGLRRFSQKDVGGYEYLSINECIETGLQLCSNRTKYYITVKKQLDDNLPMVYADPRQIEQVLMNLFINAADAMKAQDNCVLTVRSRQQHGRIIVFVEDTGPGIPEHQLQSIWQPFFTTKDIDKGTGLGLSISKGIIEEHNGNLSVENKPDGGARFVVELPVSTDRQ